jgi:putative protein-disulfide isomerase
MCSWCWGFRPTWQALLKSLPGDIRLLRLLGGLAPDSDEVMPKETQLYLQDTWRRIQEKIPGTRFNYNFWENCIPRRSTYPACRAVIAARLQGDAYDERMTNAIQAAYYLEARNPSDMDTLVELGREIGLDENIFLKDLMSDKVQEELLSEISFARMLKVDSFPALILQTGDSQWKIPVSYTNSDEILEQILGLMN